MTKVLIVDDEERMLKLLKSILGEQYEIYTALSVKEAMSLMAMISFDAVLSDVKMPGEDGICFLKKLTQSDPELPVILITGHGDKGLAITALINGAFDFLEKPFEDEEILHSVKKALEQSKLKKEHQLSVDRLRRRSIEIERLTNELAGASGLLSMSADITNIAVKAGGLVHEVANPTTIIKYNIERAIKLCEQGPMDEKTLLMSLKTAHKATIRIVDTIAAMRSLNQAYQQDSMVAESLYEIVRDTVALSERKVAENNVFLKVSDIPRGLKVECRAVQLSQVILNLINNGCNAIKNLEHRWIAIEAEVSGPELLISVTDSGSGIPLEIQEKIFEPFFTTRNSHESTGLGLDICKKIMDAHSGSLTLDTQATNTRFVIRLPLAQAKERSEAA